MWRVYARAVFTRVTSLPCRSRYTRRFVSKLVEKVSCGMNILPVEAGGMNIIALLKRAVWTLSPFEVGGMNISPDFDAEAQLTAWRSTHKHAMRLFPPVWTQKMFPNYFSLRDFMTQHSVGQTYLSMEKFFIASFILTLKKY